MPLRLVYVIARHAPQTGSAPVSEWELERGETALSDFCYDRIATLANTARGADAEGYRAEFVRLVRMAQTMRDVARR